MTLPPYGFFWFSLTQEPEHVPEKVLPREITTLVIGPGWDSMLSGWTRRTLEHDVLPGFLPQLRWFADKAARSISTACSAAIPIEHDNNHFLAAIVNVNGDASRYFLPLTIRWTRYTAIDKGPASVLAAVRRGPREGVLLDATAEPEFITAMLAKIHAGETVSNDAGQIEFRPTTPFTAEPLPEIKNVAAIAREQSNSSVIVDNKYVIKVLRRITAGIHPEVEVGRFLADVAHFKNAPQLLGSVELVEGENRSAHRGGTRLCRKPGRRLERHCRRTRPADRRAPDAGRRNADRKPGACLHAATDAANRPAHRRDAPRLRLQR